MNQLRPLVMPITTRTGKLQFIDQSNALYARPRSLRVKRSGLTASRIVLGLVILIALYFAVSIARGLPVVLAQHGIS